jgi:hypothetical protein
VVGSGRPEGGIPAHSLPDPRSADRSLGIVFMTLVVRGCHSLQVDSRTGRRCGSSRADGDRAEGAELAATEVAAAIVVMAPGRWARRTARLSGPATAGRNHDVLPGRARSVRPDGTTRRALAESTDPEALMRDPGQQGAYFGLAVPTMTAQGANRRQLPGLSPPRNGLGVDTEELGDLGRGHQGLSLIR